MERDVREGQGAVLAMAAYKKKLIEVALPLEAINKESAREKSIRHGHPSTLHLWWARRPLAACRAVIFASLVDDPSAHPDRFPTEEAQQQERVRLFDLIEQLVKWENATNEDVLEAARKEILSSTDGDPPPVLDPFCGGGSIPLEAQRLGLNAHASDLNPVAVLITKALIEIPPKFAGQPPINPESREKLGSEAGWNGAKGLAEDVRYYGMWIRDEAQRRIGHLYPTVKLGTSQGGGEAVVIAWLWARTVRCPNPACGAQMPLVRSFWLSQKGLQAWIVPTIDKAAKSVSFEVQTGAGVPRDGTVGRKGASCIVCETPVAFTHIRSEAKAGRMQSQLMAVVVEVNRRRTYLPPSAEHETVARSASPADVPESELPPKALGFRVQEYGMTRHRDLFTHRQLVALTTFSDLVQEARDVVFKDAMAVGLSDDGESLESGGRGATAYADAVATYLAFSLDKMTDTNTTLCTWQIDPPRLRATFGRQALPMTWDFAEANIFGDAAGDFQRSVGSLIEVLERLPTGVIAGEVQQRDATTNLGLVAAICTDPPYYDNIGYADLSDFFYVWLRHTIKSIFPTLLSTILTPKAQELVATPFRFDGDRKAAEEFFESGLARAFEQIRGTHHEGVPFCLFYAFKQAEIEEAGIASTGWETMLSSLLDSGFGITGTWPARSEMTTRNVGRGTNALASSIVLVCRPRPAEAPLATRKEFINSLHNELPVALRHMQQGSIAPVDLAQASIGPGMAVFSRYSKVMEADGKPMTVRTALGLINQVLDEVLAEQESEYDAETRWAVSWFEQHGFSGGSFGIAETLSKAKNTSVNGMREAGILFSSAGKVRLLKKEEMNPGWDPTTDLRLTLWEVTHHLVARLQSQGEHGAAELLRKVGDWGEAAKDLGYRLFTICDRKKWADDALGYNAFVIAWPELNRLAAAEPEGQSAMEI